MSRSSQSTADLRGETPERCLLVGVDLRSGATGAEAAFEYTAEESLQELAELAEGAGAEVLGATTQTREKADAATLVGSGKVDELKAWAEATYTA